MGEEVKSISLCLLDDLNVSGVLKLDEFEIRHYEPAELQALLGGVEMGSVSWDASDRLKVYAKCPWARLEKPVPWDQVKTSFELCLRQGELSFAHAGVRSWYPFDDLLRTLNLLKATAGPVIGRQFYYWLEPLTKSDRHVDRVIYGEPLWDYVGPESEEIRPLVLEYGLEASDTEQFCQLRKQLAQCLAVEGKVNNSHLRTAIHCFENADRKIVPHPLPGSFNAIEPLMSYEAALEALLVREDESHVEDKLSKRLAALMERTGRKTEKIEDFARRVFWLRSKVAHGARPIEEVEDMIVDRPNDKIVDNERQKSIDGGDYANLLLNDPLVFPGFLMNLRELTRICIRFFCDELSNGRDKESTIELLKDAS